MEKNKKILLIGGNGNLGSAIIKSGFFKNLHSPSKKKLNILNRNSIKNALNRSKFDSIINCAAMARIVKCEKSPAQAINTNIKGTYNLVKEILNYEKKFKKKIKIFHISSDSVYPSMKGNYSEDANLGPYNVYGWTKLASEFLIRLIDKHTIIRTRFFTKSKINFKKSATDLFTSNIEISDLVKKIKIIYSKKYIGTVNVGFKRHSDFSAYKTYKNNLKPCKRKDIIKNLRVSLAKDSSMNLNLLRKIEKN